MTAWAAYPTGSAAQTPHPYAFLRKENGPIGPNFWLLGRTCVSRGWGEVVPFQYLTRLFGPVGPIGPKSAGFARACHSFGVWGKKPFRVNPAPFGPIGPIGPDPPRFPFDFRGLAVFGFAALFGPAPLRLALLAHSHPLKINIWSRKTSDKQNTVER